MGKPYSKNHYLFDINSYKWAKYLDWYWKSTKKKEIETIIVYLKKTTITFNQCGGHFPFYYRVLFQEGVILDFKTLWNSVNILSIDAVVVGIFKKKTIHTLSAFHMIWNGMELSIDYWLPVWQFILGLLSVT